MRVSLIMLRRRLLLLFEHRSMYTDNYSAHIQIEVVHDYSNPIAHYLLAKIFTYDPVHKAFRT